MKIVFSSCKFVLNLLYDISKQNYISLQFKSLKRELRSNHNSQFTIEAGTHDKDFATIMSNNLNELPLDISQITERKKFIDTLKTYLLEKAKEKYFILFSSIPPF